MHHVVTYFEGRPVTVADVVTHLKVTGAFGKATYQLLEMEVIHREASVRGVVITDLERQTHLEAKRRMMGLGSATDLNAFYHRNGIQPEQWKWAAETDLLRKKLLWEVAGSEDVARYFDQHRAQLKKLCIARIVCQSREEVLKMHASIDSGAVEFATLARQHSLEHNSRIAGGHLGCIGRGVLPPEIERDLFAAPVGALRGPYQQNGYWAIYLVEEILHAALTDATRRYISERLFAEWLREQVINVQNEKRNGENQYG